MEVSQLLAVRIRNFGGVLRELAPGAALDRNDLRLVLFRTRSRMAYLSYIMRGLVGARWQVDGIDLMDGLKIDCQARTDAPLGFPHLRGSRRRTAGDSARHNQHRPRRAEVALPMWVGHSCPTPLTLILVLILCLRFQTPRSKSKASDRACLGEAEGSVRPTRLPGALQ